MTAYVELQGASSPPRSAVTPPPNTSARSVPATSTSCDDRRPELVDHRFGGLDRGGQFHLEFQGPRPRLAEQGPLSSKTSGKERDCNSDRTSRRHRRRPDGRRHRRGVPAGVGVTVFETTDALVTAGRARIAKSLERGVSAGKITERERDGGPGQPGIHHHVGRPADRQLVIEAVIEDETVKADIFSRLDEIITDPDAVLASNTSSIPDHEDRGCHQESRPGPGAALLQPGAGVSHWSSWSPPWRPARQQPHVPSSSPERCWASRWCAARTAPVSSSTSCWCPICCRRSGWWRQGGHRRGRRQGRRRRLVASMGPLRLSDHRSGHPQVDRRQDVRRVQGDARAASAAVANGGAGRLGKKGRQGLLRLPIRRPTDKARRNGMERISRGCWLGLARVRPSGCGPGACYRRSRATCARPGRQMEF